jgi:PKD repeat protein
VRPGAGNLLAFPVPPTAALGTTFARFRLSSAGGLAPSGAAADGEVEDYAVVVEAPPVIDVGTHVLLADTPGQTIAIRVSGGHAIDGINFNFQLGDGSDGLAAPVFTGLEIIAGTIFDGKNSGQYGPTVLPHIAMDGTVTAANQMVYADGVIGYVTIDTTGFDTGAWPLSMGNTLNGPTDFAGMPATILDGLLVVKHKPVAMIETPAPVFEGASIALDGSASWDPDGDTIAAYEWDLDADGLFETTGDAPVFSAAGYDGPATHTVMLRVKDSDGLYSDPVPAIITITNVAPSLVTIDGAPATSPEGTAIMLSSTVVDPGTADTFSYAWAVKKNGVEYATGSGAGITFTPDDNGSYEVTLTATDDDGGATAAAAVLIEVTNVAPTAHAGGPYRVEEWGTVALAGAGSDPAGANDPLTLEWDLDGDGVFGETGPAAQRGDETGVNPEFSAYRLYGPRSVTVALRARDGDGGTSAVSYAEVTIAADQKTIGWFAPSSGLFYLKDANNTTLDPQNDITIAFGANLSGYQAMVGDWDGDGVDTIGVFVPSTGLFYLKDANNTVLDPAHDITVAFGANLSGYQAIVGDWDGPERTRSTSNTVSLLAAPSLAPVAVDSALADWEGASSRAVAGLSDADTDEMLAAAWYAQEPVAGIRGVDGSTRGTRREASALDLVLAEEEDWR